MRKVHILCYHRVTILANDYNFLAVTPENFEKQIKYLKANYSIISSEKLNKIDWDNNKKDVFVITFDDGYYDLYTEALPILEKYNVPATMFISTGNIGTKEENWTDNILRSIFEPKEYKKEFELRNDLINAKWKTDSLSGKVNFYYDIRNILRYSNKDLRDEIVKSMLFWSGLELEGRPDRRLLSEREIFELASNPLITIGAHSVTHSSLRWQSNIEKEWEIKESIEYLYSIAGKKIDSFAYPFGTDQDYDSNTINILKKYGIEKAFAVKEESFDENTDLYEIPRYSVRNNNIDDFRLFIDGIIEKEHLLSTQKEDAVIGFWGDINDDQSLFNSSSKFIIWGIGKNGEMVYNWLMSKGLAHRIEAFADNAKITQMEKKSNIKVIGIEEVIQLFQTKEVIVLLKNRYDLEILSQLEEKGMRNIHVYSR